MRLNRQVPAHGAAIMGHTDVLRRLHELGADLVEAYDVEGKSPLDYTSYFCHKDATEYLRSLHTSKDQLTRYEQRRLETSAIVLQSRARGKAGGAQARAVVLMRQQTTAEKTEEQATAEGFHM